MIHIPAAAEDQSRFETHRMTLPSFEQPLASIIVAAKAIAEQ
jgi:hypothetical protein